MRPPSRARWDEWHQGKTTIRRQRGWVDATAPDRKAESADARGAEPDRGRQETTRARRGGPGAPQGGNNAGLVSDNYVRITVFLAAVLFLVGIGSSFQLTGVRYALIAFGSVLLVISIVLIVQQPVAPA
jgi:hypothetical protein